MADISKVFPGWEQVALIGKGGFGSVYEIQNKAGAFSERAAVKVISIPQNESEIDEYRNDGASEEAIIAKLNKDLEVISNEYSLMGSLRGCSNIVDTDDVITVSKENGPGWDVYIKMELLTSLSKAMPGQIDDATVIQIAIDMCKALEVCQKKNIIHRDIKPQNIFVSQQGDFKLGDFGIAKVSDHTTKATKAGTYGFMSPEVYFGKPYNHQSDIYSLGLVLYWLLNEKKLPFLSDVDGIPSMSESQLATERRMRGEKIPEPINGGQVLKAVVLKACEFETENRYLTAEAMRKELELLWRSGEEAAAGIILKADNVSGKAQDIGNNDIAVSGENTASKASSTKKNLVPVAVFIAAVVLTVLVSGLLKGRVNSGNESEGYTNVAQLIQGYEGEQSTEKQNGDAVTQGSNNSISSSEPYYAVSRDKMYSDDYILPTDIRRISASELDKFTYYEMDFVTNEIYARHGYIFKEPVFADYFERRSWYKGTNSSMSSVEKKFSTIEKDNLATIVAYEKAKGWREDHTSVRKNTTASTYYAVSRSKMYSDEYILPTDIRYITFSDLDKFTRDDMFYVTNEIYARHGYIFKDRDLAKYFESRSWYRKVTSDMSVVEREFSTIEKANIETIVDYERSKGWRDGSTTKQPSTTDPTTTAPTTSPTTTAPATTQESGVEVVDVVGLTAGKAIITLRDMGLPCSVVEQENPMTNGFVFSQEPAAGTTLPEGETVTLYVSFGETVPADAITYSDFNKYQHYKIAVEGEPMYKLTDDYSGPNVVKRLYEVVGELHEGDIVIGSEMAAGGVQYAEVYYNGSLVWIRSVSMVKYDAFVGEEDTELQAGMLAIFSSDADAKDSPTDSASDIATFGAGAIVNVLEVSGDYVNVESIQYKGRTTKGWVLAENLNYYGYPQF